jgi:hypothetical protein
VAVVRDSFVNWLDNAEPEQPAAVLLVPWSDRYA